MSKNLCYILGALRDGSLPKCGQKKEVTLATDVNMDWLNSVAKKAAEEFAIPISRFKIYAIWDKKSKQECYRLKIYSKDVYGKLSEFYEPGDQHCWDTPEKIKQASLELQKEYIAAFYDAEGGCRNVSKFRSGATKSIHCWCSMVCKHGGPNEPLSFIQNILVNVGVRSSIYDSDELVMTGKQNLRRFYETFPLQHPIKREQLKELLTFFGALSANA